MSAAGLAAFVAAVADDLGLAASVGALSQPEDVVALATRRGFDVALNDLYANGTELADVELDSVTGGTIGLDVAPSVAPRCFPTWQFGKPCPGVPFG